MLTQRTACGLASGTDATGAVVAATEIVPGGAREGGEAGVQGASDVELGVTFLMSAAMTPLSERRVNRVIRGGGGGGRAREGGARGECR